MLTAPLVLVAEDDPDDRLLLRAAFRDSGLTHGLRFAEDGQQLLDYLQHEDLQHQPLPELILLDLNMPRMDGREALLALKAHPRLQRIPVVIFSTSCSAEDRRDCPAADAWISKPNSYSGLLDVVRRLGDHWLVSPTLSPEPQPS